MLPRVRRHAPPAAGAPHRASLLTGVPEVNRYAFLSHNPVNAIDPQGEKTMVLAMENSGKVALNIYWFVNFFSTDGSVNVPRFAQGFIDNIRSVWGGGPGGRKSIRTSVRDSNGNVTEKEFSVAVFVSWTNGFIPKWDQIEISNHSRTFRGKNARGRWGACGQSAIEPHTFSERIRTLPVSSLNQKTLDGDYRHFGGTASMAGGSSHGVFRPGDLKTSPSMPAHEFGHILGFVFHTYGEVSDPMRGWHQGDPQRLTPGGSQLQPLDLSLHPYHIRWLYNVAVKRPHISP